MGWLIAAALLIALCFLPVCINITYDASGPYISLSIGFISIPIFPSKKRNASQKNSNNRTEEGTKKGKDKNPGSLMEFMPLLESILDLLSELRRRLVIKDLELRVIMADDDPCDLSINYGRAWAALGNFFPLLERFFILKKRKLDINCDFMADESSIFVRAVLSITLLRLLLITLFHGRHTIMRYIKIMNTRKGGADV